MKISVILPIYNVEPYLARCLNSLLNQTLQDIEIICVNDASPDNSAQILSEYAERDSRIKIITHKQNGGAAKARQTGIEAATGEYIGFVDPDDFVETDFFEKLYNLATSEQADIAKGNFVTLELDGKRTVHSDTQNQQIAQNKLKFFGQNLWDAIYKTDMIRAHDIHFEIDIFCFGMQAAYHANKIVTTNDAIYIYVRRDDSCDSKYFTVHKWRHWNVRGANYYLTLLNQFDYPPQDYLNLASAFVYGLYFYGYDRLSKQDRKNNTEYLADCLIDFAKNLKHKEMFTHKLSVYEHAVLNNNKPKLLRLLRLRHFKPKFIRNIICSIIK